MIIEHLQTLIHSNDAEPLVAHLRSINHLHADQIAKISNHQSQVVRLLAGESITPLQVLGLVMPAKLKIEILLRQTVLPDHLLQRIGCDFADHVIEQFEDKFANDSRPRDAIDAKHHWIAERMNDDELASACNLAWDAFRDGVKYGTREKMDLSRCRFNDAAWCAAMAASRAQRALSIATRAAGFDDLGKEREWQVQHLHRMITEDDA